jgi:hypothetical protein
MTPEMHKVNGYSALLTTSIISLFASLILVFLATNGTFDLFQPSFLWKAYNHYFLSLIDGRLDVPAHGIGKEGSYIDDKVFMYYGMLPTLPRFFLHPFIDLNKLPASYFSILFFTLLGNVVLQHSIVKQYLICKHAAKNVILPNSKFQIIFLVLISLIVWFGSATFLISQNATIYHEPYAAALCIVNIFLALLIRDGFFLGKFHYVNLMPYAFLAGLCTHARMPTALSLYLVTGLIMLVQICRQYPNISPIKRPHYLLWLALLKYWKEVLVLGFFGLSILLLNFARYGDLFNFMGVNNGFVFFEGWSERQCSVIPHGTFHKINRIIVNTYVYLSGDWQNHWSLIRLFSTGYGRVEMPAAPIAVLWAAPITCFIIVMCRSLLGLRLVFSRILLVFILAFSAGALFQLSYPTITHRYIAELWLPLGTCLLFCWYSYLVRPTQFRLGNPKVVGFIGVLAFIGVSYQLYLAITDEYYLDDGPVTSLERPSFHYPVEDYEYLGTLTNEKIKTFYIEREQRRQNECAKFRN